MRSMFLPVGLILAMAIGLLVPVDIQFSTAGIAGISIQQLLIIGIFLVSGYKFRWGDINLGKQFVLTLLAAVAINLVLGPVSAVATAKLLGLEEGVVIGLVVMASVPTTLASGIVIVRNAGGNTVWALMLTVMLTFIGVLIIPFLLDFFLSMGAAVDLPVWPLMLTMIKLVLLPLLAGAGLQRLLKNRDHAILHYLPPSAIIAIVWMSVSQNAASLFNLSLWELFSLTGASLIIHLVLLIAAWGAGIMLRLGIPEARALLFVAAQKTLPVAVAVLVSLPQAQIPAAALGIATVTCVVFHFAQIIVDSFLASWMVKKA